MPDPDSTVGQLACALRRSRAALGFTQAQAAEAIDKSISTVQRAEAGAVRGVALLFVQAVVDAETGEQIQLSRLRMAVIG
ncbi:helix-turn-helix domain-containing protein [Streptomyces sp. NRAIS4]